MATNKFARRSVTIWGCIPITYAPYLEKHGKDPTRAAWYCAEVACANDEVPQDWLASLPAATQWEKISSPPMLEKSLAHLYLQASQSDVSIDKAWARVTVRIITKQGPP